MKGKPTGPVAVRSQASNILGIQLQLWPTGLGEIYISFLSLTITTTKVS